MQETSPRRVRVRPWSVLVRVEADRPIWLKAASPGSVFEAGLTEALSRWTPDHVLTPYAVDAARGWSLLPSGGDLLRSLHPGPREWEAVLTQYADLQLALVPRVDDLLRLGVPDARIPVLAAVFDEAVAENRTLSADERAQLRAIRPRVVEWCEELRAIGVPDSLDHADLHDGQILVAGTYTFFDWGDANVGHPFFSRLVALERAADMHGPEVVARLEDAYLDRWAGPTADLRRAAELARRLSHLTRLRSWARLFPAAAYLGDPPRATALRHLLATH
ncbi:MAG TPA: phosphotransferase [Kribbella sp.]